MKRTLILWFMAVLFLLSCEKKILQQSDPEDLIVVEAYLYEGEAVDDIYLAALLLYGGEDTVVQTISDAAIEIIHNNNRYPLVSTGSAGHYHYPGTDLAITVGETYQLEIDYFNKTTTAETTVPFPPIGVAISQDTVSIDVKQMESKEFWTNQPQIEISWDQSGNDYFYILVENIEAQPVDIFSGDKAGKGFRKITLPVQGNSYTFMPLDIIHQFGTHLIRVFSVNKEYADLYESMDQDSRDLNEPLSNIANGLGVFTAFSSDSLYFEVVQD